MVAIHLDDLLCDSDSDSYDIDDNQQRRYANNVLFPRKKYVWEDVPSEDDDDTEQLAFIEQIRRLEDDLNEIRKEGEDWMSSRDTQMDALEEFLSHDSALQRQANHQQEVLLESLRQQHQEEYLKNKAVVQSVEKQYEEEKRVEEEKKRVEEEKKRLAEEAQRKKQEEEERLAVEARMEEERQAQKLKNLEEKEKELYKLIQRSVPEALEKREAFAALLETYDKDLQPFCDDPSMKDARRGIKKFITLSVQQISATQEQVRKKSMGLIEFLSQQHGIHQKFALVTLASKMVSQCEAQVALIPSFAFPLGEVSTSVGRAYPDFTNLLIGMIQKECPLCVPMLFQPGPKSSKNMEFYRAMRFRVDNNSKVENEEEYVNHLQGYVRVYAALLQTDTAPDLSHASIGQAWTYLAWLLNDIPACRYSASALDAFLSVAGFRLFHAFKKQFEKLMEYISTYFLRDLLEVQDPDASAVATRLESYVNMRQYMQVPKGRNMPLRDASSQNRA